MDSKSYVTMDPKVFAAEKEKWAQKFIKDPELSEKFVESVEAVNSALKCVLKNFPDGTGYQMILDLLAISVIGPPEPGTCTTFTMLLSALVRAQNLLEQPENSDSGSATEAREQTTNTPKTPDEARDAVNSWVLSACDEFISDVRSAIKGNGLGERGDEGKDKQ